jgi:hypothetical protein
VELELRSGRRVTLERLNQLNIYAGLLEGHPHRKMNDGIIEGLLNMAKKDSSNPHLIAPLRRDYHATPGDMQSDRWSRLWDKYAPPILEPALGQLLTIDWESLAEDIEW